MAAQNRAIDTSIAEAAPEDVLRAGVYRLLASLLSAPPGSEDLARVAALEGDGSELGKAVGALARTASGLSASAVAEEYQALFIGLGRGEVVPFASYYLTGFLHEKPLAKLRYDMARLGVERAPGVSEPEDHAASILEIMAGMIDGAFGLQTLAEQKAFYERHVSSWMGPFFKDVMAAKGAVFYAAVGGVGRAFMEIEDAALPMD